MKTERYHLNWGDDPSQFSLFFCPGIPVSNIPTYVGDAEIAQYWCSEDAHCTMKQQQGTLKITKKLAQTLGRGTKMSVSKNIWEIPVRYTNSS